MKDPTLLWALWATTVALAGLIGAGLRAILTGKLVPRTALDDAYRDRDKWETAANLKDQAITEFRGRLDANTEALELVLQLTEALATKGPRS